MGGVVEVVDLKSLIGHERDDGLLVAAVFLREVGFLFGGGIIACGGIVDPDEDVLKFALGSDRGAVGVDGILGVDFFAVFFTSGVEDWRGWSFAFEDDGSRNRGTSCEYGKR